MSLESEEPRDKANHVADPRSTWRRKRPLHEGRVFPTPIDPTELCEHPAMGPTRDNPRRKNN